MPAKLSKISEDVAMLAAEIGAELRARRRQLGVTATAAAQAAGMSRVTWYRIENGEPSVTLGACLSAMSVLDLKPRILAVEEAPVADIPDELPSGWIPARIPLADYPQLRQLAWQLHGVEELSPREAFGIYERNARHLDPDALLPSERSLIDALKLAFADEGRDV